MLAKRSKALFVDKTDFYVLVARTSGSRVPMVVEEVKEFAQPPSETDYRLLGQAKANARVHARFGFAPPSRFIRRASLDAKRMKEGPTYLLEMLDQQFRIDGNKSAYATVSASDGKPFDVTANPAKEVILCGALKEDCLAAQNQIVADGVFPDGLEISSVALIGGLLSYSRACHVEGATLVLELLGDQTHVQIVTANGLDVTRTLPTGYNSFMPVVKAELGLRDEESARKVFFSNSFDFTTMGAQLIKKLVRDLQSAVGFYEVQTGQSIGHVFMPMLPNNLRWLSRSFAEGLGVSALEIDFAHWLPQVGIRLADASVAAKLDSRWLPLFALMIDDANAGAPVPQSEAAPQPPPAAATSGGSDAKAG